MVLNELDIKKFYSFFSHNNPSEIMVITTAQEVKGTYWVRSSEEFCKKVIEQNSLEGYNVYIGGRDRTNRGDDSVVSSDFIFLEIDEHDISKPEHSNKLRQFLEINHIEIGMAGLSGGGYHFYIPLPKKEFNTPEDRENYKKSLDIFKRILTQEGIDIDQKVFDLQRVSRVLGTFNWKRGKLSQITELNLNVDRELNHQNLLELFKKNAHLLETSVDSNALEILEKYKINETDKWLYDLLKSGEKIKADTGGNSVVFKNAAIILVREQLSKDEIRSVGKALADLCEGRTLIAFMGWIRQAQKNKLAEVNYTEINNFIEAGDYEIEQYSDKPSPQHKTNLQVLTYSDLKKFKVDKNFIVQNFLYPGSVNMLYAPPAQFKSLISAGMGFAVSNGLDFLGMKTKKSPVLYLDGENSQGIMKERAEQIHKGFRIKRNKFPLFFLQGGLLMDSKKNINQSYLVEIEALIKKEKIRVIIFDTLHRFCLYDENSSDDLNKLYTQVFKPLADELKVAVVFLHHSTKSGGYRGSGDFLGMVDVSYRVERKAKTGEFKIINEKCRSGEIAEIQGEIVFGDDYIRFNRLTGTSEDIQEKTNKLIGVTQRIEELFDESSKLQRKDIISFLEMAKFDYGSTKSIDRALKFLVEQKKVLDKSAGGVYSLI